MNKTQQTLISRDRILEDAVRFYNTDEMILTKLYVRYAGDQDKDLEGVSRNSSYTFWKRFSELYPTGDRKKYFRIGIESIEDSDLFAAAGRILIHGFINWDTFHPILTKPLFSCYFLEKCRLIHLLQRVT